MTFLHNLTAAILQVLRFFWALLEAATGLIVYLLTSVLAAIGILFMTIGNTLYTVQSGFTGPSTGTFYWILKRQINQTNLIQKMNLIFTIKTAAKVSQSTAEMNVLLNGLESPDFKWNILRPEYLSTLYPNYLLSGSVDNRVSDVASQVFDLFEDNLQRIDMRAYCLLIVMMYATGEAYLEAIVNLIFEVYAGRTESLMSKETFGQMMKDLFEAEEEDVNEVFDDQCGTKNDFVSKSEFMKKILPGVEFVNQQAKQEMTNLFEEVLIPVT